MNDPVSGGTSPGSTDLPEVEVHSTELSGGIDSPEIETVTLGGFRSSLPIPDSAHQEFPIIIAVGGGHRKLLRQSGVIRYGVPWDRRRKGGRDERISNSSKINKYSERSKG